LYCDQVFAIFKLQKWHFDVSKGIWTKKKGIEFPNCKKEKFQITKFLYKDFLLAMNVEG
jgi:hypothetical protein